MQFARADLPWHPYCLKHPMPLKRFIPFLTWSVATWFALACAIIALQHDLKETPAWWGLIIPAIMAATPLAWRAVCAAQGQGRAWRVIFWMLTLAGTGLCLLLLYWQWNGRQWSGSFRSEKALAALSAVLPALIAVWICCRHARSSSTTPVRWFADAATGFACLIAILCAAHVFLADIYVPHACHVADARWAAIGRPMPEFEKRIVRVDENASLQAITRDLEVFGIKSLYKPRFSEENPNTIQSDKSVAGVIDILMEFTSRRENQMPATLPVSSRDAATAASIARAKLYLEGRADDFSRIYNTVLHTEPPVWGYDPADGWEIRVPNYLSLRVLTQCIATDAFLKIQRGDTEGARTAVAANLRLIKNMETQPILVSLLVHGSMECLLQSVLARLPAEPDDMKNLAADVQTRREALRNVIQAGYIAAMHWPDHPRFNSREVLPLNKTGVSGHSSVRPLDEWLMDLFGTPLFRLRVAKDYLLAANEVEITQRATELAATDLGSAEMERVESGGPWLLLPNIHRAWLRINFMLLLREQANLIRSAQAQMQAGKTGDLGDVASVVIPGSKWKIHGDTAANSVSLKLDPIPRWVSEKEVAGDDFFLLPPDGTKSWKFSPPPQKTAAVTR